MTVSGYYKQFVKLQFPAAALTCVHASVWVGVHVCEHVHTRVCACVRERVCVSGGAELEIHAEKKSKSWKEEISN